MLFRGYKYCCRYVIYMQYIYFEYVTYKNHAGWSCILNENCITFIGDIYETYIVDIRNIHDNYNHFIWNTNDLDIEYINAIYY